MSVDQTHFHWRTRLPGPTRATQSAGHGGDHSLRHGHRLTVAADPRGCGLIPAPTPSGRAPRLFCCLVLTFAPLCSALGCLPLLTAAGQHRPPPSPPEPGMRFAVTHPLSSTSFKPEPTAIASVMITSSVAASSPTSSPSPATIYTPSALPPLQGGPHNLVVCLCPHLHRWQCLV
jgi:hypothetical protein